MHAKSNNLAVRSGISSIRTFRTVEPVLRGVVAFGLLVATGLCHADRVNIPYLQGLLPKAQDAQTAHGADLLGDRVNLFNGALEFEQTDISIPGNSELQVAITRRHVAGRTTWIRGAFADWDLELPRISGVFSAATGWVNAASSTARCTEFTAPPIQYRPGGGGGPLSADPDAPSDREPRPSPDPERRTPDLGSLAGFSVTFQAADYWQGTYLHMPGMSGLEVLRRTVGDAWHPTDGRAYPLLTKGGWQISCLPTIQNGAGNGFLAVSPQGVRYSFDWMASRPHPAAQREGARLARNEYMLLPSVVTDRFGNEVKYFFDPANPARLLRIQSNDGRTLVLAYNANGRIETVSAGPRVWTYIYSAQGDLYQVVLPDSSRWTFNLRTLVHQNVFELGEHANCEIPGFFPGQNYQGSVTHPSGAVGEFTMRYLQHPRSNVTRWCEFVGTKAVSAVWPKSSVSLSLTSKRLTGPGLPSTGWQWTYSYPTGAGSWAPCSTCSASKTVTVTDPAGVASRHTFGVKFQDNEGQLLSREDGISGSQALRTTQFRYRKPQGMRFSDSVGVSVWRDSDFLSIRNRPQDLRQTFQQNSSFTWEVTAGALGFDERARVLEARMASSLGYSKSMRSIYADHPNVWVMGQVQEVWDHLGRNVLKNTFDPLTALPAARFEYGLLKGSFEFHREGTLHKHVDPAGRATHFNEYRRGVPTRVTHKDGHEERAVVNDFGQVTQFTNEAQTTTGFEYDSVGRLTRVDYPSEAGGGYFPTIIQYGRSVDTEHGMPPGTWRQVISTGGAQTWRWYDALMQLRLEQTVDVNRGWNTSSMVENRFDHAGRKTFQVHPQRVISPIDQPIDTEGGPPRAGFVVGTAWAYDSLGRVVEEREGSELGELRTVTEYKDGFERVVTNPRGYATTFSYQAYEAPSEDWIVGITSPESVRTTLSRDPDGQPIFISRGGSHAGNTQQAVRRYVYDLHRRLCKTVEPESGSTVQHYDIAGNVGWRASGQNLPLATDCNQSAVPDAAKITFRYDTRDRLEETNYGDSSPSVTRRYTPDGLLSHIASSGSHWSYYYNNRRLLWRERAVIAGQTHDFDRGIEGHGHVASQSYPTGLLVNYSPDALGRPTEVSGFASNVVHHPHGMLASYVLNNGRSQSVTTNKRGLAENWVVGGLLHDRYLYDRTGNVSSIEDLFVHPNPAKERNETRHMAYDGLDRLTIVNGRTGGSYNYDALDNLVYSSVALDQGGNRTSLATLDPTTNRITQLNVNGQALPLAYDANGNLRQRGTQLFGFDIGNRNWGVIGQAGYAYDGHGRRYWASLTNGTQRHYAYSQAGKLLMTWDSARGTTAHVYLDDKLLAEVNGISGVRYSHTDALGSPVVKSDGGGAEVERLTYEAYGGTASGAGPSGIGFTGHVYDAETGLVQMQQRYYDPIAGQFLSIDPVTTDPKTGNNFNRYLYAKRNPYRYIDPDGRQSQTYERLDWYENGPGPDDRTRPLDVPRGVLMGTNGDAGSPESNRQGLSETPGDELGVQVLQNILLSAVPFGAVAQTVKLGLSARAPIAFYSGNAGKLAAESQGFATMNSTPIGRSLDAILNTFALRPSTSQPLVNWLSAHYASQVSWGQVVPAFVSRNGAALATELRVVVSNGGHIHYLLVPKLLP